ncbi:MAG TPA: hypothetical protein VJC07_02095 [Candidatus Nanoarchaeia archaeon]|nr:hypothetical protein [Candidatus Nanoarchaeia archaeon]
MGTTGMAYDYLERLAEKRGMTAAEYRKCQYEERQRRPLNQVMSRLITARLAYLRRTPAWLADEIGVCRRMAVMYADGSSLPKPKRAVEIFKALRLEGLALEDLLQINNGKPIS